MIRPLELNEDEQIAYLKGFFGLSKIDNNKQCI